MAKGLRQNEGEHVSRRSPHEGQNQGLREHLPYHTGAARANRKPDRDFALPICCTRCKQARQISASRKQYEGRETQHTKAERLGWPSKVVTSESGLRQPEL
jgi:hypothetical protein